MIAHGTALGAAPVFGRSRVGEVPFYKRRARSQRDVIEVDDLPCVTMAVVRRTIAESSLSDVNRTLAAWLSAWLSPMYQRGALTRRFLGTGIVSV